MLAKATAGFGAALASGSLPTATRVTAAEQASGSTQAGEWSPPQGVGGEGGALQFEAEFPFHAVAPHWSGAADISAAIELSLSSDGSTFSDPVVVGPATADAGRPDRDGRTFGQLVMTEEARFVRYRVLDADGNQVTVPGLAFTYINAAGGPALGDIKPASIPDSLSRPPIITREQWGASLAYGGEDAGVWNWTPEYQRVEHIIIHHSDTPSFRDPLVEIRSIHYYHAVTRGWGDIGYNFLVDFLGNVYEGRKGGDNVVGGHAYQYAYGSSGICSMGDFALENSTPEAIGALVWISAWAGRDLDPLGRADFHETPNLPTICGHRDVVASDCPGDALWADLPYIRNAVAQVLSGGGANLPEVALEPGDVVRTVASNANLRANPASDADIEATLPADTILTIIQGPTTNDGYVWYRVAGESTAGWLATVTFTVSTADPPERTYGEGDKVEVATNLLNIRSEPGLYGDIVATMTTGDTAHVLGTASGEDGRTWVHIDSALGTGWVAAAYVAPSGHAWVGSSFGVGDRVEVGTNALSLRSDASTSAPKVAILWEGTQAVVIDGPRQSTGFTWLQIRTAEGSGWVAEQFLTDPGDQAQPEGRFSTGDEVIVDTDALNLRASASINGDVIAVAWFGTPATVVDGPIPGNGYVWYHVETPAGDGWVVDEFLSPAAGFSVLASGFEPGTPIVVTTDSLNLRSTASASGDVVTTLPHGAAGTVMNDGGYQDGYTWVQAKFDNVSGFVATEFIGRSRGMGGAGTSVVVISDNVNIRERASTSAPVVGQAFKGDTLTVSDGPVQADGYSWFEVDGPRWSGWTVSDWLSAVSNNSFEIGSTIRVVDGELNLRQGPSTSDGIVRIIPDGAILEVLDGPEHGGEFTWYRLGSSRYGTGWAADQWLVDA